MTKPMVNYLDELDDLNEAIDIDMLRYESGEKQTPKSKPRSITPPKPEVKVVEKVVEKIVEKKVKVGKMSEKEMIKHFAKEVKKGQTPGQKMEKAWNVFIKICEESKLKITEPRALLNKIAPNIRSEE